MVKLKSFFKAHKYFFAVFAFIVVYETVVVRCLAPWRLSSVGYSFLALDYDLGFASGILPGAVYHWLFGEIILQTGTLFITFVYLTVIAAEAFFIEKLLVCADRENRRALLVFVLFFLTGPCTFSVFYTEPGAHEFYWFFFIVFFFVCMSHRALYVFSVPICVFVLLVNWNALVCVVPFFCILLLYRLTQENKSAVKRLLWICFALCVIISIPFALYLMLCVPGNMKYSLDDFRVMMLERGVEAFNYPTSLLYRMSDYIASDYTASLPDSYVLQQTGPLRYFFILLKGYGSIVFGYQAQHSVIKSIGAYLAAAPIVILLEGFFLRRFKNEKENKLKKFVFFCMFMLFFFSGAVCMLTSFDYVKWLSINLILSSLLFFCVLHSEKDAALSYLSGLLSRIPSSFILTYFLAYAFLILHIYY